MEVKEDAGTLGNNEEQTKEEAPFGDPQAALHFAFQRAMREFDKLLDIDDWRVELTDRIHIDNPMKVTTPFGDNYHLQFFYRDREGSSQVIGFSQHKNTITGNSWSDAEFMSVQFITHAIKASNGGKGDTATLDELAQMSRRDVEQRFENVAKR